MPTLLSIDPSAEVAVSDTGWCLGYYTEDEPFQITDSGVIHGGFQGFIESVYIECPMWEVLNTVDTVVCEDYKVFNKFGDPSPLKIIGVVQYLRPDVVLQVPSGKNTLVPDEFLKRMGHWGTKGSGAGHHRDQVEAIRHAYFLLARNWHTPTLQELTAED